LTRVAAALDGLAAPLYRGVEALLCALVVGFTTLTFVQVVLRYGFNRGLFWADELTLFLFTWTIFLSAALTLDRHAHFSVQLLVGRLPASGRRAVAAAVHVAMVGVCAFLLWYGAGHARFNWAQASDVLRLPLTWWYLSLPVASAFMLLSLVRDLAVLLGGGTPAPPVDLT
jgi:TRAP-type C4-dicarboxylate transport system permease small subunit